MLNRQRGIIPIMLIVYLVAALAAMGMVYGVYKWIDTSWETSAGVKRGAKEKQAEWDAANAKQREKEARQISEATTKQEAEREKTRTVYKTITRNVDRYIDRPLYRADCFDSSGLSDVNSALRGPNAVTLKPDGRLPGPDAAGRSKGRDSPP